jgi:hypothetical protein
MTGPPLTSDRRRDEPQAAVASPLHRRACPVSGLLSTGHALSTCSQTLRARAAQTRAHRPASPHQPAYAAERAVSAAIDPCQLPRCVTHAVSFLQGLISSKMGPGRPRSAISGELPPREWSPASNRRRPDPRPPFPLIRTARSRSNGPD